MKYDLATMTKRARNTRRRSITFRPITAPGVLASDLYATAYADVIKAWQSILPRILAEYERSLSGLTTDSAADIGNILTAHESDIFRILLSIKLRIEQWSLRVERFQRGKWRSAVLSATGVDLGTLIGPEDMRETLAMAIERNVSLVKSVSEQSRAKIGEAVFRGLSQRRPAREVGKEIAEAVGIQRKRALNIAADQTVKVTSALNRERRREAGLDTWEWLSSHKVHFRPEHAARDGKRYSDEEAPEDLPGDLPFCGCGERAVLSLDGEF